MALNNLPTLVPDTTTSYFNNFFQPSYGVSTEIDGAITGFFEQSTGNKDSAKFLASSLIYTAKSQGLSPMEVLSEFASLPKGQLNSYLTMFLNLTRVGTSYLGMSNVPITNKYISRTILP